MLTHFYKLESRLLGEISITSDMQMTPPYGRKWRGTKEPLDESERGEWKSWLNSQHSENEDRGIWSHYFKESGPITSWETIETVSDFIFLAPKSLRMVTAAAKLKDAYSFKEKLWPT